MGWRSYCREVACWDYQRATVLDHKRMCISDFTPEGLDLGARFARAEDERDLSTLQFSQSR